MAGKGGGAWKVAYADFVTAMMAFFMVMWLISQSQNVKTSVAKHFRNPGGRYAPGDSLLPPRTEQYFRERRSTSDHPEGSPTVDTKSQEARKPYALAINNGHRTSIGTVVSFSRDSAELDESAHEQLKALVPLMIGKPQKIEIRGHASRRNAQQNVTEAEVWANSFERCVSVLRFIEAQGIPAERCRLSQAGAFEPYPQADPSADEHSRVEVFLLSETVHDALGTRRSFDQRFQDVKGGG